MTTDLTHFETARSALALASTVDEVKAIRDKAEALRAYHAQIGASLEMQNQCADIKIRAERRGGELLIEMKGRGERDAGTGGNRKSQSHDVTVNTLPKLGIDRMQASRWQTIAKIPERDFEQHVQTTKASRRELTSAGVLKLAKKIEAKFIDQADMPTTPHTGVIVNDLKTLIDGGELFSTVYADPPWQYGNQATRASTDNHYPTMTLDDICALPVSKVVDENAHLHLWTTNGFLFDAKRVMESWGFEYRSCFVWVKPQMGIGNYWRVSHEFMLFGIRGKCPFRKRDQMSWREMDRGRHSSKPDDIRQIVEQVSPGPFLEMFGRIAMPNWTVFGNQVERSIFNA